MGDNESQEWRARCDALLDAALTLSPDQRDAFLDAQSDAEAVAEIRALLAAAGTGEGPLDGPAARSLRTLPAASLARGTPVGAWRLLELVGRGGMGEVYRAERADGAFEQQVAIKLIRPEAVDQLRRFHDERQLLARLDHPGIARLLDGGVVADGRPYMVMEWIDGRAITDWCRTQAASLDQRIELFLQVCEAVAYAHRNLLVHRDLKPANVLVTPEGRVKLLDFGVAKLLDAGGDETRTIAPMTPAYAAPEQLAQGVITTATDLYALGLLLFELMTGERPFHAPGMTLSQLMDRQLRRTAPAASATARRLPAPPLAAHQLRGDLDAIIAKALRPEPEQRYETVAALQADLQRHLRGEPVAARRGARGYLLGRFLVRHRWAVAGVAVLILTLVAGLAGTYWQARKAQAQAQRAEVERARAQREAARATATKDFLVRVFKASDPRIARDKPRGQITAKELLDLNAPKIREEFADDPDTQLELLGITSAIYDELDEEDRHAALRDERTELARRTYGDLHPIVIEGLLDEASEASHRTRSAEALRLLDEADDLIRRAGLEQSLTAARASLLRGRTLIAVPDAADARLAAMRRAVDLYAAHAPRDPGYVHALVMLGGEYIDKDPAQSEQLLIRALAVEVPERERNDSLRAGAWLNLAQTQKSQGKFDAALASYAKADEIFLRTRGEGHWAYWEHYAGYAQFVHQRGDRIRAGTMFQRVLKLLPADWKMNTSDTYVRELYANCLLAEGRPEAALPYLETAQRVYQESPSFEYDLRRARLNLAEVYAALGRDDDARAAYRFTLDDIQANFPPDHDLVAQVRERWGRFLFAQGDDAGAEREFREILARAGNQPTTAAVARAHAGMALVALRRGDAAGALQSSRHAVELFDQATGNNSVRVGPDFWVIHSEALRRSGDAAGARTFAGRALDASRKYDDPSALSIAQAQIALANADLDLGDPEKARGLAADARAIQAAHRKVPDVYRQPLRQLEARLART